MLHWQTVYLPHYYIGFVGADRDDWRGKFTVTMYGIYVCVCMASKLSSSSSSLPNLFLLRCERQISPIPFLFVHNDNLANIVSHIVSSKWGLFFYLNDYTHFSRSIETVWMGYWCTVFSAHIFRSNTVWWSCDALIFIFVSFVEMKFDFLSLCSICTQRIHDYSLSGKRRGLEESKIGIYKRITNR